jgi:hypothetical protein
MIRAIERNATEVISFSAKNSENLNFFLRDSAVKLKPGVAWSEFIIVFLKVKGNFFKGRNIL